MKPETHIIELFDMQEGSMDFLSPGLRLKLILRDHMDYSNSEADYCNALECCHVVKKLSGAIKFESYDYVVTSSNSAPQYNAYHLAGLLTKPEELKKLLPILNEELYGNTSEEWCDEGQGIMCEIYDGAYITENWPLRELFERTLSEHILWFLSLEVDEVSNEEKLESIMTLVKLRPNFDEGDLKNRYIK
jgi:hypothetical protein